MENERTKFTDGLYLCFKIQSLFLLIAFQLPVCSQHYCDYKYDHVWILGDMDIDTVSNDEFGGCEIDFNTSPPSFNLHPKSVGVTFQNSSMSSKDGELIFYSNGCSVFNRVDVIMENGDSLNTGEIYELNCPGGGYGGFQNMISIPDSYHDSIYYVFHITLQFNSKPNPITFVQSQSLSYTKININANEGYGSVIEKNVSIISDTNLITTPLTAVKHANGLDWWLITPDRWSNSYNIILLNESGPAFIKKQFIGIGTDPLAEGGQGKFSPVGDHFAWYHPLNGLFLFDFDREHGVLSDFEHIEIPPRDFIIGGCEFSPNGRYVYLNNDTSLYQVDLLANDIQNSLTHIGDYDGFGDPLPTSFFFMERTPEGKIIMNVLNGSQYLHLIHNPDLKGLSCNFEQHSIQLPTTNNFTIPHFPNYRLGSIFDPFCDSISVYATNPIANSEFSIMPNPASDVLNVLIGELSDPADLVICDMHGREWVRQRVQQGDNVVNLDLHSGMYVCMVYNGGGLVYSGKVVVVR